MIYIRVDMNEIIATGHLMRCLSIADAVVARGGKVVFITADKIPVPYLIERGYDAVVLDTSWDCMEQEITAIKEKIQFHNGDKLLIDSYQVTEKYLQEITKMVYTIYLDDLNAFLYPVNCVLCYANYWERFHYQQEYQKAGYSTSFLLGCSYMPLRNDFVGLEQKDIRSLPERLLIMSGGSDPYNVIGQILENMNIEEYTLIDVICGRYYQFYDELKKQWNHADRIHIHHAVDHIEDYMKKADIAVSAGGTTLYELCACGTPTITYSFADNQINNVMQFQKDGIMEYAGDVRFENVGYNVSKFLKGAYQSESVRRKLSEKMQLLVDGKGAERIAHFILEGERS